MNIDLLYTDICLDPPGRKKGFLHCVNKQDGYIRGKR